MCYEKFKFYPRCGHIESLVGEVHPCMDSGTRGKMCTLSAEFPRPPRSSGWALTRQEAVQLHEEGKRTYPGGWRQMIREGCVGFCPMCVAGITEPLGEQQRRELWASYDEHRAWRRQMEQNNRAQARQMQWLKDLPVDSEMDVE